MVFVRKNLIAPDQTGDFGVGRYNLLYKLSEILTISNLYFLASKNLLQNPNAFSSVISS